ncbi:hypothetical protein LDENG_00217400 [Lucifuga dentata]|nr:hypothetical protein LDENG_00217400 [Lucifuga dentata]
MISCMLSFLLLLLHTTIAQNAVGSQIQDLSNRNLVFATQLYRAVSSRTDDNVFLCPFTLSVGLSALMSGADGTTRLQLLQELSLTGLDPQEVPDLFQSLIRSVTQGDGAINLRQSIAILPANRFQLSSSYGELVQSRYGGIIQNLVYTSPQEALDTINRWVQDQTADQVQGLVDSLDPQTQLLLATAGYYQTEFSLAFNSSFTQDERFYVDRYHIIMVPMMFRSDKYFLAYDRVLRVGVLKLPMVGGAAMLVLLPDENVDVTAVEEDVTAEKIQAWIRQLKKTKLEVQFPRFLLDRSYSLRDVLQTVDITQVFQDAADLSNISADKNLKLTQVFHKAVIRVDESAGGTGGGGANVFSSLPPRLTINRPFLFLVYQEMSGSMLFMGRVVDPTRK